MTDDELKAKLKPVERVFDDLEDIILPDFSGIWRGTATQFT